MTIAQALELAFQKQQAGELDDAEHLCRQILSFQPRHADAWHLLGAVAVLRGDSSSAIESLSRAVELAPDNTQFLGNLGFAQQLAGRLPDAEQTFRRALELAPAEADLWFKAANVQLASDRLEAAENFLHEAIRLQPNFAQAQGNLGALLVRRNRPQDAIAWLRRSLAIDLNIPETHLNLAVVLLQNGEYAEAEFSARRAVALRPQEAGYHAVLAETLAKQGRHDDAIATALHVTRLAPNDPAAWRCLATICSLAKQHEAADEAVRAALRLCPDDVSLLTMHCVILHDLGRLDESIATGRRALEIDPHSSTAADNLGAVLSRHGDIAEALTVLRRAVELDSENALARFHLALTHFLNHDYEAGWCEHEWRLKHPQSVRREVPMPRWRGESLAGRSLLLQAEQGFGDALHFIRYARVLREQGARVTLECLPPLVEFLSHCQVVDQVVSNKEPPPLCDFHCPLLSLGELLRITPDAPRVAVPYLRPHEQFVARWKPAVERLPGLRVGICWQGDKKHTWDRFRSIHITEFEPLALLPNVTLVSLQCGYGLDQLDAVRFPIQFFQPHLDDGPHSFRDTAAVMSMLDLVITIDSAVAHLAGGLGVPTWLLLNHAADWRWGLTGDTTPWYPSLRLFRQETLGEWKPVFARVAEELASAQRRT